MGRNFEPIMVSRAEFLWQEKVVTISPPLRGAKLSKSEENELLPEAILRMALATPTVADWNPLS
jgi:hypothetical protein